MSNVTQLWDACAQSIRDQVSDGVWQSTFKEARPQSITENELILTVPNQWVKAQVEGKYNPLVLEALEEASPTHIQLIVEVDTKGSDEVDLVQADTLIPNKDETPEIKTPPYEEISYINKEKSSVRNEKYTFETFVTGTSNRFAHAAALSVAERPAESYNPLFIHGEAGLSLIHI